MRMVATRSGTSARSSAQATSSSGVASMVRAAGPGIESPRPDPADAAAAALTRLGTADKMRQATPPGVIAPGPVVVDLGGLRRPALSFGLELVPRVVRLSHAPTTSPERIWIAR